MCKKSYPDLIHKKSEKMLLLTDIKNIRGHYAHQISTYTTSHPCRFGPFVLRHDWVTGGTWMHATHDIDVKNIITDAALEQGKLSWRPSSSRYHWESTVKLNTVKHFLKNIKHFLSKDTVSFVNISILIMIKIGIIWNIIIL